MKAKILYDLYRPSDSLSSFLSKLKAPFHTRSVVDFLNASILLFLSIINSLAVRLKFAFLSSALQSVKLKTTFYVNGRKILAYNINNFHYIFSPFELYELEITKKIAKNGISVDGGAYIGTHSLIMAFNSFVYAFEPNPENFNILTENIKINKLRNVVPLNKGLSSFTGEAKFLCKETKNLEGTGKISENGNISIQVVKMDDIVKGKVSFIKIDVEGHELEVLKGSRKIIKRNHPIIMFEALNEVSLAKIIEFLIQFGYLYFYKINEFSYLASTKNLNLKTMRK